MNKKPNPTMWKDEPYICQYLYAEFVNPTFKNGKFAPTISKVPIGCVVSMGKGRIGWAIYNVNEEFYMGFIPKVSKKSLREIALKRAEKPQWYFKHKNEMTNDNTGKVYRIPTKVKNLVEKMEKRSERYWNEEIDGYVDYSKK